MGLGEAQKRTSSRDIFNYCDPVSGLRVITHYKIAFAVVFALLAIKRNIQIQPVIGKPCGCSGNQRYPFIGGSE